ncbi:DUF5123 domain-containing protein [Botryobacter ruber]|uniref:DUF5123 domain-containing protein n=1 Tax=Botryobacter ruber TaxID=2171629 RepID=UPI000E0B9063|nr:DUF5123 domain-containing protein [Botryobacter ruber]
MFKLYFKGVGLLALLLLLVSNSFAQTTHNIPNTRPDTLRNFILNGQWAAGDTVMLTSSGIYQVSATIDLPRSVHIKGDPALAQRPVIRFSGTSGSIRANLDNTSLSLIGIDFNGYQSNGTSRTDYIFRGFATAVTDPAGGLATTFPKLVFKNSEAWGFKGGLIVNNNSLRVAVNELVIDNVEWHDMVGAYAIDIKQNAVKSLRVMNSTFYNIANGFINNPYFSDTGVTPARTDVIPQNFVIEDNTFYNVSGAGGNTFIQMNDPKDQSVTLTFRDNVVSMLHTADNARPFRIDPLAGTFTFENNVFHEFTSTRADGEVQEAFNLATVDARQTNVTATNTITENPAFANAAVGNFRIPAGSPLLTAGTNGGTIGDPSWTSGGAGFATHQIPNTEPDTLKKFVENTALWAPGDVIMLVSAGNYEVNNGIDIKQDVTIMGDPSLAQRPTVTLHGGAFKPRANNLDIILKGFNVNGLTEDAEGEEQRAAVLRFGGRSEGGEVSGGSFRIEEMNATGLSTGVELFYDNGLHYEELVLNNVWFNDIEGWVVDPRLNATDRIEITNSTFSNFGAFLKNPYNVDAGKNRTGIYPMTIMIDHNTFYNGLSALKGADAFIQINDPKEGTVSFTFSNNIVSTLINSSGTRPFRINEAAGTFMFRNNLFHNFESSRDEGAHNLTAVATKQANVTVVNPVTGEPMFANPAAGNFGLPSNSSLLTASTTSGPIGDPTWATGEGLYTIHQIPNTEPDTLKAFIENTALWAPGDVIMLVSAGNYDVTGSMQIMQDVTIMGDPSLSTRPLVKVSGVGNGGAFVPAASNLSIILKGFDFDGRSLNASNQEQKAALIQYAAGAGNAMGGKLIRIEDMYATGMTQGIELFPGGSQVYDKVEINNVHWNDISQWIFWPRINAVKEVSITNSTFSNAGGFINNFYFQDASRNRPEAIPQNVVVDHNTFYNIADGNRALLQMNDGSDNAVTLTFTNNIVSKLKDPANSRPFLFMEARPSGTYSLRNNVFHDFLATDQAKTQYNLSVVAGYPFVTEANNTTENPNFAAPENGNFKLPNGSPLATAGTDGGLIGDPQWAPDNVTSIKPELKTIKVEVYPNPVRDVLYINAASEVHVTIYNMTGSAVWTGAINKVGSVDIAGIKSGLYIVRINAGSNVQTVKILKQ